MENNWISVKDRLPDHSVPVLCARLKGSMSGYNYISQSVGILNKNDKFSCEMDWVSVTHWQPLPDDPPKF